MKNPMILITRPKEDAEPLAETLRKQGFIVLVEPMLSIKFREKAETKVKEALAKNPQAVIVTSSNGIRALAKNTKERNIQIVTVGDATAKEANNLKFKNIISADGDVNKLTKYITKNFDHSKGHFLHITGSIAAGDLKNELEKEDFKIESLILYDSEPAEGLSKELKAALINYELNAITFYSPRTAEIFVKNAQENRVAYMLSGVKALCFSKEVAKKASVLKWSEVLICRKPDQDSMLKLIRESLD